MSIVEIPLAEGVKLSVTLPPSAQPYLIDAPLDYVKVHEALKQSTGLDTSPGDVQLEDPGLFVHAVCEAINDYGFRAVRGYPYTLEWQYDRMPLISDVEIILHHAADGVRRNQAPNPSPNWQAWLATLDSDVFVAFRNQIYGVIGVPLPSEEE